MIKSIRYFLLISLLASITVASAINGVGNYLLDEQVIQPYLDSQLVRVAGLLKVLNHTSKANPELQALITQEIQRLQPTIGKKFMFQILQSDGKLIMHSQNVVPISLKDSPIGFSDKIINNNDWRIYSEFDKTSRHKVIVAELYNLRRELADDIARSNANILLITYPLFGILVWLIVSFALRSITRVTNEISDRASTFLEPVQTKEIPVEIKPLVAELNNLFIRLQSAFDRNKRFAGDAAHELRTPLAALKTHVQLAMNADNKEERDDAFQKVLESVNRSSHVVAQLLTLSRLGEEEELTDIKPFDLHRLATEIIAYLAPKSFDKDIELELLPAPQKPVILGNETAVGILIRNIVDNAIRYTPEGGAVKISIINTEHECVFRVEDNGPGIAPELRDRVFERFFRVLGSKAPGSGLGLAIVSQISKLHHAKINISTPASGQGLQFDVVFLRHRL